MDLSDSPFRDLDVTADWSGDPADQVEVKIVLEVQCVPYLDRTILNAHKSRDLILSTSIEPVSSDPSLHARLQEEEKYTDANTLSPTTPRFVGKKPVKRRGWPNRDLFEEFEEKDSIVVPDSPGDDFHGATILTQPFVNNEKSEVKTPNVKHPVDIDEKSPLDPARHSRKRSATTASLPDSISDSDRPYGGYKHKASVSAMDPPSSSSGSTSTKSIRPSLIPRPVNALHSHSMSYHPGSSGSRVKNLMRKLGSPDGEKPGSAFGPWLKEETPSRVKTVSPDGTTAKHDKTPSTTPVQGLEQSSSEKKTASPARPVTPTKNNADTRAHSRLGSEVSEGNVSTVASCGTPCDIHHILDSYGTTDEEWARNNVELIHAPYPYHGLGQGGPSLFQSALPRVVNEDGAVIITCPPNLRPAKYKVTIALLTSLDKGTPRGWLNFVLTGLPRLQNHDTGYLYFWTPPGQGLEIRTTDLKRHTLIEGCMMGQFPIFERLVIPVRPCDGRFYGFLKDFKVTQTIRTDMVDDEDPRMVTVKYHAVCMIDLIQRSFWAEKCGVTLYVYGGPEGDFSCHLHDPRDRLQTVHLDVSPNDRVGISEIQIICSPSNLEMLTITWETRLPRENASAWMPRVLGGMDMEGIIDEKQCKYSQAEDESTLDILKVVPNAGTELIIRAPTPEPAPESRAEEPQTPKSSWIQPRLVIIAIITIFLLARLTLGLLNPEDPYGKLLASVSGSGWVENEIGKGNNCDNENGTKNSLDEVAHPAGLASSVNVTEDASHETVMPLRDRVDYFLGWRGPFNGL
ncbi:uncharacterized protein N7483_008674 [Penicillium malachiteum]|uniref:uncharacterized protein n=1 Tax=Penicillium malachiteum TaxID=1324776 RepID=UPI00254808B5|nr:uncharacterized protein N7483_008674 [Penicillium malachiteum]KAJ5720740.1 hypothetical protein N7483_008674 [Penicillium malachiteum]